MLQDPFPHQSRLTWSRSVLPWLSQVGSLLPNRDCNRAVVDCKACREVCLIFVFSFQGQIQLVSNACCSWCVCRVVRCIKYAGHPTVGLYELVSSLVARVRVRRVERGNDRRRNCANNKSFLDELISHREVWGWLGPMAGLLDGMTSETMIRPSDLTVSRADSARQH